MILMSAKKGEGMFQETLFNDIFFMVNSSMLQQFYWIEFFLKKFENCMIF